MTERAIHIGLLIASTALAGWAFAGHARDPLASAGEAPTDRRQSPLTIIPPGSAFLLSANVAQIARSPLAGFVAQRLARVHGASDLIDLCGFEPLTRLSELALAVPSAGSVSDARVEDFGIVATGQFSGADITRCASAVIAQRGGQATTSTIGSFGSVRDGTSSGGEVAAKDGLLIVSGGAYFRSLLDAAEGASARAPAGPREAQHGALRRALGPGDVIATWLLPSDWFERVTGDDSAQLSPLRTLQAIGARLVVGTDVRVSLLLQCTDTESATRVASLLDNMRKTLGSLALSPALSEAAKRIELAPDGAQLRLTLALSQAELTPLLDLLLVP